MLIDAILNRIWCKIGFHAPDPQPKVNEKTGRVYYACTDCGKPVKKPKPDFWLWP